MAGAEEVSDEPDPARSAPKGKGVIWGVIRSEENKESLIEAQVFVLGSKKRVLTDVDGRFRLELPPGTYDLRVVYELHQSRRVQKVKLEAGAIVKVEVALPPDKGAMEETEAVEADVERGTAASQLMIRKNAAAASDAVSAQDIARTPDRNAADAARRIVGATLVDGRYLYVRGLGERYSNALLNGTPLPSPEPDRQAVPLDLFPSLMISDIQVSKTFIPDMPGDFAGGSINVHTRDLPPKFTLQTTLAIGANTQTTFAKRLSYDGGSLDWLGFDNARALPKDIPDQKINRIFPDGTINPNLDAYGRSINSSMTTSRTTSLPNGSISFVIGDTLRIGKNKNQALSYQFAAGYTRKFSRRVGEEIRKFNPHATQPGALELENDYRVETGLDQVTWSGLGAVSYAPTADHKLTLTGIYSRAADNEARSIAGFNEERRSDIADTRLRFVSRNLTYGQLRGEHRFSKMNGAQIAWNALFARAGMDEPNTRETIYGIDPVVGPTWLEATLSGSHFYANQTERTYGGGLDFTQPLTNDTKAPKLFKIGGLANLRHRYFEARRFRFRRSGNDSSVYQQPADLLFRDENIGPVLALEEWTSGNDTYKADYNVFAGYLMGDFSLSERIRVIAGERVETARQTIDSFNAFAPDSTAVRSELNKTDLLPSGNVIIKATESSNVRLSVSRTVARPQLRELAPFTFIDYFGAREVKGNPDLDRSRIINYDARYEWFPGAADVIAATLFAKSFDKPIEPIINSSNQGIISFQNAKSAINLGLELEARKGLGFIHPKLANFTVMGNLTLVHSRVQLDKSKPGQAQTNDQRPLAFQSPFIINGAIDYNREESRTRVRLLYNVFGKRIAQVGQDGLPDVYEQPRHQLDASVTQGIGSKLDVKLAVDNILNTPYRFIHDGTDGVTQRYRLGTTFWLSATLTVP